MRLRTKILALLPLLALGCSPTRIVTVTPSTSYSNVYTTVTAPRTKTITKTEVYAVDEDICLQLDLQAVAAAFAQSSNVQEFESLLNNSSYILSNLDLNRDGYVDYLRVLETVDKGAHVFLIQAVLATNVFQDVATLIAEITTVTNYHVQVVGAPYIYGTNYIIEPIFITRPMIFTHLVKPAYAPWRSPWYWSHFPPYYKHPAPIHLNHYMAYVDTFMRNHHYCHSFSYAASCHYPNYHAISKKDQRNDFGVQHPEMSFSVRTAKSRVSTSTSGAATPARAVSNARDVSEIRKASSVTTVENATRTGASRPTAASTASRSTSTASRSTSTESDSSTATPSRSASTASRSTSTATPSRSASSSSSASSGSTATPSRTTSATPARSASSSSTSSSSTAAPSRSTATASPSRSTSASSSKTSAPSGSQTTRSRVTSSGSSSTKISTTSPSGSSSTVSRTRTSSSSSAARR